MADIRTLNKERVAKLIDTMLVPHATWDYTGYQKAFETVKKCGFGGVFVLPYFLKRFSDEFGGYCKEHGIDIIAAIGDGSVIGNERTLDSLVEEIPLLVRDGATVIDFIAPVGFVTDRRYKEYGAFVKSIADTCHANGVPARAILVVDRMEEKAIPLAARYCAEAGVDAVKTCADEGTAFGRPDMFDVARIRKEFDRSGTSCQIIASNIQYPTTGFCLMQLGADRINVIESAETAEKILDYFEMMQGLLTPKAEG